MQTPAAQRGINITVNLIPAILFLVACALCFLWNMSDKECIEMAAKELETMGVITTDQVIGAHRKRIKKAYPAYFDTYAQMDTLVAQLNKYSNLFCIGRNGQHRYNNMDHSMLCGIEAVRALLGEADRTAVWNVNTEEEYHETK